MSIEERYFTADKNYLLKTVQAFSKQALVEKWAVEAYNGYMVQENPLGLEDDFTLSIKNEIPKGAFILEDIYDLVAAVYRYKHGDNQLSFLWDGRTHMEHYDEEWRTTFLKWISLLCQHKEVYRTVIKAAMADRHTNTDFLAATIRRFVLKHFNVRVTRSQRLMVLSA
jgi:hypothetical protein